MANESISFPEEFIPDVVGVIRRGLKDKSVKPEVKEQLGKQCDELEAYWKRGSED